MAMIPHSPIWPCMQIYRQVCFHICGCFGGKAESEKRKQRYADAKAKQEVKKPVEREGKVVGQPSAAHDARGTVALGDI